MIAIVGLTGGIACGKSLLERALQDLGCRVLDADSVVHLLQEPAGAGFQAIVAEFGTDVLSPEGKIDRVRLGEIVFADEAKRERLGELIHPLVRQVFLQWIEAAKAEPEIIHIGSIPLLYECDLAQDWPFIVCVGASPQTQIARMVATRGLSEQEAQARLAAQWPIADKLALADYTIWNNGDDPQAMLAEAALLVDHLKSQSL